MQITCDGCWFTIHRLGRKKFFPLLQGFSQTCIPWVCPDPGIAASVGSNCKPGHICVTVLFPEVHNLNTHEMIMQRPHADADFCCVTNTFLSTSLQGHEKGGKQAGKWLLLHYCCTCLPFPLFHAYTQMTQNELCWSGILQTSCFVNHCVVDSLNPTGNTFSLTKNCMSMCISVQIGDSGYHRGHRAAPGCMIVLVCFANVNKITVVLQYSQKCKEDI